MGSSVHGIFLARILEWVAISSSRRSSCPRDQTCISWITGRFFFLPLSHWGSTHNFIFEPYFAATSTPVLVHLTRFQFKTKSLFSRPSLPFTHMDKIVTNTKIWKSKWAIKRKLDEKNPSMYITEKVSGVTCTVSSLKVIFTEVQSIMFQRKTKNDETFRLYFIIHPPFKYGTLTVITRINAYCVCLWNENILFL